MIYVTATFEDIISRYAPLRREIIASVNRAEKRSRSHGDSARDREIRYHMVSCVVYNGRVFSGERYDRE